jgi:hypothetical protein
MAEISIIDIRQGPVGPAGPAANVTQANIEAAITDKPGFLDEIGAVSSDGSGITDPAAFRGGLEIQDTIFAFAETNGQTTEPAYDNLFDMNVEVGTYEIHAVWSHQTPTATGVTKVRATASALSGTMTFWGSRFSQAHQSAITNIMAHGATVAHLDMDVTVAGPNFKWGTMRHVGFLVVTAPGVWRFRFNHREAPGANTDMKFFLTARKVA